MFATTLGFYLLWVPRFLRYSSPPTGDQPFYLMDVASIAQDGDLNVKNNYDDADFDKFYALAPRSARFAGMSAPYPLPPQLAANTIRPQQEEYSHHLPGLPILLVPAWKIGGWFQMWWPATIVAMCALSALLAVNVYLFALQISASRAAAVAVWLAISFSTPVLAYSYLIFTELCVGLLVVYAVRRLSLGWKANGWGHLLAVGLSIGYIPWLAWRCVLLSATLTLYATWQWWSAGRALEGVGDAAGKGRRPRGAAILVILVPVLVSVMLILRYHYFLYGEPFPDARVPELDLSPFHWPWEGGGELAKFLGNAFGLFFDQTFGLLPWAPVYLLAIAGAVAMLRGTDPSHRRLVPALLVVVAPYLVTLAAFEFWNGIWCPPGRYLTSLVPLAAGPLGAVLGGGASKGQRTSSLLLLVSLAAPGWGLAAILLHDARLMWPSSTSPALDWLVAKGAPFGWVDLRRWIPTFVTPDETRLPYLLFAWLAACCLLVVVASALSSRRRSSWRRAFVAWAGAFAVVGGAGAWFAFPYLKHKTALVEQGRWDLGVSQEDPRGIAFLDDKIYVAIYGRPLSSGGRENGRMLVFDPRTAVLQTMPVVADGVELGWDFPADVKVGPDGLLYVLNNGPGDRALLAVRPDGEVVRRLETPGSTSETTGLAIRRDGGAFYVADMAGGAVWRYILPSGSGTPEGRTILVGLNNPSALAIDAEDRLYVNESFNWIRQLTVDGELLRTLEKCSVRSFAALPAPSHWIEASCDQTLFSIDTAKSTLQLAYVESGAALQGLITSITYGSDGLLYTLQGDLLVAYRVEH